MKFILLINVKMPTIVDILTLKQGKNNIWEFKSKKILSFLTSNQTDYPSKFHICKVIFIYQWEARSVNLEKAEQSFYLTDMSGHEMHMLIFNR